MAFRQLAAHSFVIRVPRIGPRTVDGGDLAADTNAPFVMEPAFPLPHVSRVLEKRYLPVRIGIAKNDIRYQLLEAGIPLDLVPRAIGDMLPVEEFFQVSLDLPAESLKVPHLVKHGCGYDEHALCKDVCHE